MMKNAQIDGFPTSDISDVADYFKFHIARTLWVSPGERVSPTVLNFYILCG